MHINLESDYAVRIVQYLAQSNERRDAQSIADSTCVSLRFTLKIMRKLVAADIVQSFKGAHGGYTLSRPASSITLRQVIEAVEGPYRFSRCVDNGYACNCSSVTACPFHSVFDDITQMVIQKLDEATFDSL
ncbi:MAG: Rrf2 family transcriptional regulator [Oscillospiraceae bacterium]|jgi:transcriptional regulator, Rrf2 family|nr:Rrf2 family transcriptional regulator [Oscillospiraceae bacterium]